MVLLLYHKANGRPWNLRKTKGPSPETEEDLILNPNLIQFDCPVTCVLSTVHSFFTNPVSV